MELRLRIIGNGRAGGSLAAALTGRAHVELLGRSDHSAAAHGVDLLVLAVPDGAIADCAATVAPGDAVVAHLSGATGLDALRPHARVASLHPLVSLPDAGTGAQRLRGAWMAIAGDPMIEELARLLDARTFQVDDERRALYHATASVAANHLVALLAQVERLAALAGVPPEPFMELAAGALANTSRVGAAAALTGPVSRGDWATVRRHLAALPAAERPLYLALAAQAAALAGRELPADLLRPADPG
jgi:predicted short-subunit dehydrogenase-like oxidoreductase (DUF2520 family)